VIVGLGCASKETDSESIRIKASKVRGEALGRTFLHLAPDRKIAERLIKQGADVNAQDSFGMTPLHTAVISNRRDVAELLIARGADINARSHRGQTPLFWAVTRNHKEMAEWLIAHGADVNAKDNYGITSLHSAAHLGSANLVELLITNGAEVNTKDNENRTPLDCTKEQEIVELLLRYGAKESQRNLKAVKLWEKTVND